MGDLLRAEQLPSDAAEVHEQLRCFVFGNPPQRLQRIRVMGTVVRAATCGTASGVETVVYLDDASGVIPVVLPRHADAAPTLNQPAAGPAVAWSCDPDGPAVGEVVDVFGTLHSGHQPALADADARQRWVAAAGWVRERDALQETYRALKIRSLYRQSYFRAGLGDVAGRPPAPIAPPRPPPAAPPPAPARAAALTVDGVLAALQQSGGGTVGQLQAALGGGAAAAQIEECLRALQESFSIYDDGGVFRPL